MQLFARERAHSSSAPIAFRMRPDLTKPPQAFLTNSLLVAYIAAIAIGGGQCSLDGFAANISLKGSTSKLCTYACLQQV